MLSNRPFRIHTILIVSGIQSAKRSHNPSTTFSRQMRFDMICEANGIEHRLTKPNLPWSNGQAKRMNRMIKEATGKRCHYDSHDQLRTYLADSMAAYNLALRLKSLNGAHALRKYLQDLDFCVRQIHHQSDAPNAVTEHIKPFERINLTAVARLCCVPYLGEFVAVVVLFAHDLFILRADKSGRFNAQQAAKPFVDRHDLAVGRDAGNDMVGFGHSQFRFQIVQPGIVFLAQTIAVSGGPIHNFGRQ